MANKPVCDMQSNRRSRPLTFLINPKDFFWGVVDIVPSEKTDFPDTRNKSAIHSANGSCMVIPREGDKIRVYIQLSDTDAVDSETGRIDLGRYGPERLLEVAKKTFRPYTIDAEPDKIEWWTIYQSGCRALCKRHSLKHSIVCQSASVLPRDLQPMNVFSSLAMLATRIRRKPARV